MKPFLILIALMCYSLSHAQSLGMQQLGSLGGQMGSTSSPILLHSMGAVAASVIQDNGIRLDQGMFLACDLACTRTTTGIESTIYAHPVISAYPNPAQLYVNLSGDSRQIAQYKLFNPTGQLIAAGQITEPRIDVSTLPAGLYLLQVYGRDGALSLNTKLVKRD